VSATPPSVPAPRQTFPARWILWGALLFVGLSAGIALLVLSSSHRTVSGAAVPVSDAPAGIWAAGKIRAPDFKLTDQDGTAVSVGAFRGRPVIVTFIDPLCRDFCPLEARHLASVVRSFPEAQRPTIIAVSVNVHGNARANLVQDIDKWNVTPQWHWGVGTEAQLASVWKRYRVGVLVSAKRRAGVTVYSVAHTEASYVVDARGYQRAVFLWPYTADAVTRAIRGLASS
jgi:cytochrome oxidase Cu insertion factor (SCO1/SenC/PrrC family)